MLGALSKIFGFNRPAPPPPLPPKRRTAAAPVVPKAKLVSDTATMLSDTPRPVSDVKLPKPHTVAQAIVTMGHLHGGTGTYRGWWGHPKPLLDARCRAVLGDELHSYCHALILVGSRLPVTHQPLESDEAYNKRMLTNLNLDSVSDIDLWEKAMDAWRRKQQAAHRAGLPLPDGLTIPEPVLKAIAQRAAERAERLERAKGGRGGTGGGPPSGTTTTAQSGEGSSGGGSRMKGGGKKRDDEDDEGNAPPPPAGPRR